MNSFKARIETTFVDMYIRDLQLLGHIIMQMFHSEMSVFGKLVSTKFSFEDSLGAMQGALKSYDVTIIQV
jgi:hypothetical protein